MRSASDSREVIFFSSSLASWLISACFSAAVRKRAFCGVSSSQKKVKKPAQTANSPSITNIQNQPGCPIKPCISSSAPDSGEPSVSASGAPI